MKKDIHAVTGAFGYSGKYIAKRLVAGGKQVRTLTNSTERHNTLGDQIQIHPFNFDKPEALIESLQDVTVLYNTYWVRFNHTHFKHTEAVHNTKQLFNAAKIAGVERIVHVSITNPSLDTDLEYFHGKAVLEQNLIDTGIPHTILRPTVLFGFEDILVNNIIWLLRRFPFFGVFGDGQYKLQPIYVDDLAKLAVEQGDATDNTVINAIGPETFTFHGLVETLASCCDLSRPIIQIPPGVGYFVGKLVGWITKDVVITREEIRGLMENRLYVDTPPTGKTSLTDWVQKHADRLGRKYTSELRRREDRKAEYL